MKDSSMRVSSDLLDELHSMKQDRQETYEDIIWRLIEDHEGETQEREPAAVSQDTVSRDTETEDMLEYQGEQVDLELPGSGQIRDRRERTIYRMAALLREGGEATKQDFLELIDPDEVGYTSKESFWSNCVKGRKSLKAMPGVVPPSDGMRTWCYNPPHRSG